MTRISRRSWLKGMALFWAAAGLPLMLASTSAEAKEGIATDAEEIVFSLTERGCRAQNDR